MVKLKGKWLRVLKILHLLGIICWCGGCVVSLFIVSRLDAWPNKQSLLDIFNLLKWIDLSVIAMAAMFTVCIGLVYGIFTPWGFKKTRWIAVKWLLSLAIIISGTALYVPLLEQMQGLIALQGALAVTAAEFRTALSALSALLFCHLSAMVLMVVISVLRPRLKTKNRQTF